MCHSNFNGGVSLEGLLHYDGTRRPLGDSRVVGVSRNGLKLSQPSRLGSIIDEFQVPVKLRLSLYIQVGDDHRGAHLQLEGIHNV